MSDLRAQEVAAMDEARRIADAAATGNLSLADFDAALGRIREAVTAAYSIGHRTGLTEGAESVKGDIRAILDGTAIAYVP
jgi:hypothetical protein